MAFEQSTRNRLQKFVADARALLSEEFTRQMQNDYGLNPTNGSIASLDELRNLDDAKLETARILRETVEHYASTTPDANTADLLLRIVREQAFTVLNRLAALRMAEARGFLIESLGNGYSSKGFQLYQRVAGTGLGETGDIYRVYLFSLFDEFSLDLKVLFDRFSPFGRLFPREKALLDLLALMNHHEVAPLWAEDETVGWIYQYFNSKDERKKMRDESSAPRNSRELAVRNQFFTPRYVVEFLTDNTLGRTWYEMTRGQTSLVENCRYLVRRPTEIFLGNPNLSGVRTGWLKAASMGDFSSLPETPSLDEIGEFALLIDGYLLSEKHRKGDVLEFGSLHMEAFTERGVDFPEDSFELWLILFAYQRGILKNGTYGREEDSSILMGIRKVYEKLRDILQNPPDNLSQEQILQQPVYIAPRPLKDPREILMLDPACGSMHFGLYAFDLFLTIYAEAWELEETNGADSLSRSNQFKSLRETYENDREKFLRDVPRLIIENNIHGVDIDPRAVQIAGLSLWLRAQRAWSEQNVKPLDRPQIRRSNIVCAEPMPGEANLLEEFITKHFADTPEKRLLGEFVRRIFDSMKLAGEAGSLLKIEEEVANLISESREQWRKLQDNKESFLFEGARVNVQPGFDFEVGDITDVQFWDRAESEIYKALRRYSEVSEDGAGYQRRLFADDAAQGFAFIDLCRRKYDTVLMNPPFGDATPNALQLIRNLYPESADNLYVAFHSRANSLLTQDGCAGIICSRTFVTYRNFEKFRKILLNSSPIKCFADLGWEVLDGANVETACFVTTKNSAISGKCGPFYRLLNVSLETKEEKLLSAVKWEDNSKTFFAFKNELEVLPGSPLCYWSSSAFINEISNADALYPSRAYVGLGASPHAFYFRAWWEVQTGDFASRWKRICRGGEFSPFYRSNALVIDWLNDGATVKQYILEKYPYLNGNYAWKIQDEDKYELAGFTWGKRNEKFNMQVMPEGHIFTDEGQGVIPEVGENLNFLLGYMNSSIVQYFLSLTSGLQKHYVYIRPVPVIEPSYAVQKNVENATSRIVKIKQTWDSLSEISPLYLLPSLQSLGEFSTLSNIRKSNQENWDQDKNEINILRSKIDKCLLEETSLNSEDINEIQELTKSFPTDVPSVDISKNFEEEIDYLFISSIFSYLVGCAFGRWDARFAAGEKSAPELPDPFAPLPVCPPGMLQNAEGLPAAPEDVPADYPLEIVWNGILVDDAGNRADVENQVRACLQVIFETRAEAIETEACEILGVRSLRDYFRRPAGFFADHLKRYSKSRRQAPIYLPLSTRSGEYTLWLYYHRLNDQTLYTCINDYVEPKLKSVRDEANALRQQQTRSKEEEKRFEQQQNFQNELEDFRDELLRLAPVWKPNLNDGVQITMSPLWKLFGLAKWQKTLKETWQKLEKGDYDWAHLAYSFYPERVEGKCVKDKSLAIAHDLEDLYIEPPPKPGKKKKAVIEAENREMFQDS